MAQLIPFVNFIFWHYEICIQGGGTPRLVWLSFYYVPGGGGGGAEGKFQEGSGAGLLKPHPRHTRNSMVLSGNRKSVSLPPSTP